MFLAFKKFYNLNINKNDKVVLLEILKLKLSGASVEQMELYTDTKNFEAVTSALSPCIFFFRSLLFADEFADDFANKFASGFVTKFFPNSYL